MGKKAKGKPGSSGDVPGAAAAAEMDEELATQFNEVKSKGNKLFANGEHSKAIDVYDKALKLLPEGTNGGERADLLSNKAACYIKMKRFKDAVRECTSALQASSSFPKALQRRSHSYEQQGLYKQALSDIQQVNKTDAATDDTRDMEKRLKEVLSGKRVGAANGPPSGISGRGLAAAVRSGAAGRIPQLICFSVKCSLDDESKLIHISHTTTYAELLELVKAKFPNAGPVVLKYLDREGDLITITERADISTAIGEVVSACEKQLSGVHGVPRLPPQLPPIKIHLFRVEKESEVPQPPEEEIRERQNLLATQKALAQARAQPQS